MNDQSPNTVLQTCDLSIGYRNRKVDKVVADEISTSLHAGEVVCLLGPNGSGKSTLIKTLAGMQEPLGGGINIFGRPIQELTPKAISKKLSTVLTDRITIGNLDVFTLVSFGRSPYTGWLGSLREKDKQVVQWAIEATGLQPLVHRDVSTLSDGERQKVMIARALAQDTDLILLDEPTAHLDLPNRVEIMRLLRKLAGETGKGILLSTHELDLALKAGDVCWLISNEGKLFTGVPEDLVLNGTFEQVFARDSFNFDRATGSFKLHEGNGKTVSVKGDEIGQFWTRRALEREGFTVIPDGESDMQIEVTSTGNDYSWELDAGNERSSVTSMQKLIALLEKHYMNK